MNSVVYSDIGKEVPQHERYLTVDEIDESTREIARTHRDIVKKSGIGKARNGEEITLLRIGEGKYNALVYAFPHPNEPVGSLTVQFIAKKLAEDKSLLKKLNFSWYLVDCLDRDGARRNESWFANRDPLNIAKTFHRWPMNSEVEWGFPAKYKRYSWDTPPPETQALMTLIDGVKFHFVNCLQDQGAGGVLFTVSRPCDGLYANYQELAKEFGQPLHQVGGTQYSCTYVKLSNGVYIHGTSQMFYDWLEDRNTAIDKEGMEPLFGAYIAPTTDPVKFLQHGTPSFGYGPLIDQNAFIHMTEVSRGLFYPERPDYYSLEESNKTLADVSLDIFTVREGAFKKIESVYKAHELDLSPEARTAIQSQIANTFSEIKNGKTEAARDKHLKRRATLGETHIQLEMMNYQLNAFGRVLKILREHASRNDSRGAQRAMDDLSIHMEEWRNLMKQEGYELVPIKQLVGLQVACNFATAEYLSQPSGHKPE